MRGCVTGWPYMRGSALHPLALRGRLIPMPLALACSLSAVKRIFYSGLLMLCCAVLCSAHAVPCSAMLQIPRRGAAGGVAAAAALPAVPGAGWPLGRLSRLLRGLAHVRGFFMCGRDIVFLRESSWR